MWSKTSQIKRPCREQAPLATSFTRSTRSKAKIQERKSPSPEPSPPPCDVSPRYQTSPSFRGFKPEECKPEMNRQYETDDEEFGEPNELDLGFTEPCSVLLTPRKRKRL